MTADFDALLASDDSDNDLVRNLRAALKAQKDSAKQVESELATLRKVQRTTSLADVLKAKGVNEKAAKYFPGDLDPTVENVDKWLTEDGDLFGIEVNAGTTASNETQQAAQAIAQATAGAQVQNGSYNIDAHIAAFKSAKTEAELAAAFEAAGLK